MDTVVSFATTMAQQLCDAVLQSFIDIANSNVSRRCTSLLLAIPVIITSCLPASRPGGNNTVVYTILVTVVLPLVVAIVVRSAPALPLGSTARDKETEQALFQAARDGDTEKCRKLFQQHLSRTAKKKYQDSSSFSNHEWYQHSSRYHYPLHEAARNGHVPVVELFVQELHFNVNQYDKFRNTPLFYAAAASAKNCAEEMCIFLLQHGAQVNRGGRYGPLYEAVSHGNANVVTILLQHQADPNLHRKSAADEALQHFDSNEMETIPRCTDMAIEHGYLEILSILLHHGAYVGQRLYYTFQTMTSGQRRRGGVGGVGVGGTALNRLLLHEQKSLKTKLDICHLLVQHANHDDVYDDDGDDSDAGSSSKNSGSSSSSSSSIKKQKRATKAAAAVSVDMLLQNSLLLSINKRHQRSCTILIQAGVNAILALFEAIQAENTTVCQLLLESGVDPFHHHHHQQDGDNHDRSLSLTLTSSTSPFQAAARLQGTAILQLFLQHWNKKHVGGRDAETGMYPIHVMASYQQVSLPAIQLLIEGGHRRPNGQKAARTNNAAGHVTTNNNSNALMTVDEKHGLFPFHFAALSDVNLDVLYCILKHYPDALAQKQQEE
jgi:ankyrin repeat protein